MKSGLLNESLMLVLSVHYLHPLSYTELALFKLLHTSSSTAVITAAATRGCRLTTNIKDCYCCELLDILTKMIVFLLRTGSQDTRVYVRSRKSAWTTQNTDLFGHRCRHSKLFLTPLHLAT